MSNNEIELVLFDLGGVLVELGDKLFPESWFPSNQKFKLKDWLSSETAIKFETGEISSGEFIRELKQKLSLSAPEDEVFEVFESWPKGFFATTDALLERLRKRYRLAVLSNTNEIHAPIIMNKFGLESRINDVFFSHLIGHSKPSQSAFLHVLGALNLEPNNVIFFDDLAKNVQSAKSLGIRAHQVSSPTSITKYI